MQKVSLITGLIFLGISIYIIWESLDLEYYTKLGPGGGFFPFWLGIIMAFLTGGWIIHDLRKDKGNSSFLSTEADLTRIISIIASLLAVSGLMNFLGFQLTMFLFLTFLLKLLGRQSFLATLITAISGSFLVYHIFIRYLDILLPPSSIKFLSALGL